MAQRMEQQVKKYRQQVERKKKDVTTDGKVKRADGETHITTHQSLKRFTKETALMVNTCVADSESIFE